MTTSQNKLVKYRNMRIFFAKNLSLVNKIFPDLKDYLGKEEEQDKLYYSSKIRELQEGTKGGRRKQKGGDSPTSASFGSILF